MAQNDPVQLNVVRAPAKERRWLLREEDPALGQPLRAVFLCKSPYVSLPRQPGQRSHLPTTSDCSPSFQPAQPKLAFFIKRLRVLLAVHLPSVHHIAMRCHGNDHAPGDICCLLLIREATASPATPVPEAGMASEDAPRSDCKSWELCGLCSRAWVCTKLFLPRVVKVFNKTTELSFLRTQ